MYVTIISLSTMHFFYLSTATVQREMQNMRNERRSRKGYDYQRLNNARFHLSVWYLKLNFNWKDNYYVKVNCSFYKFQCFVQFRYEKSKNVYICKQKLKEEIIFIGISISLIFRGNLVNKMNVGLIIFFFNLLWLMFP